MTGYNEGVLEPLKLPAGVHAEVNEDDGTVDVVNLSDADVLIANVLKLKPGERVVFFPRANCIVTARRYQRP